MKIAGMFIYYVIDTKTAEKRKETRLELDDWIDWILEERSER